MPRRHTGTCVLSGQRWPSPDKATVPSCSAGQADVGSIFATPPTCCAKLSACKRSQGPRNPLRNLQNNPFRRR
eukprot:2729170-Alexandrium_andersonii.AAC.1